MARTRYWEKAGISLDASQDSKIGNLEKNLYRKETTARLPKHKRNVKKSMQ